MIFVGISWFATLEKVLRVAGRLNSHFEGSG